MNKIITYRVCCAPRTKLMSKLICLDRQIYTKWLDFFVNTYTELSRFGQEKIENPTIASFIHEAVECFDGIGILHQKANVSSAELLLRKLMELHFQIKFILQCDTQNRALAYEAYYASRKTQGQDDARNIYLRYDKYRKYKKEADRIYNEANPHNYPEWYELYDIVEKQPSSNKQRNKPIKN